MQLNTEDSKFFVTEITEQSSHFYSVYPKPYLDHMVSGAEVYISAGFLILDSKIKSDELIRDPVNSEFCVNNAGLLIYYPETQQWLFTTIA